MSGVRPGALIDGRYEIVRQIGSGGFGIVYEAIQEATGQRVALKIIRPERLAEAERAPRQIARFEREARLIGRLGHPAVVRLLDAGRAPALDGGGGQLLYTVLELVSGDTLAAALTAHGPLQPAVAKRVMSDVLDALGHAHSRGVIHRDLKPSNIILQPRGVGEGWQPRILDFGVAVLQEGARPDTYDPLTRTGELSGTPAYMAPEQLRERTPTPAADIYSWGLIYLQCLTGVRAITGDAVADVIFRQLNTDPVPIPERIRRTELGRVLERAVAKDLRSRFQSASDVAVALAAAGATGGDPISPPETAPRDAPSITETIDAGFRPDGAPPACPRCESPAPPEARFCSRCGQPLTRVRSPSGPRRLTVLYCQLMEAGRIAARLEPKAYDRLLRGYHARCRALITDAGGRVAHHPGDGLLAYFGYPAPREDDALRAVEAARQLTAGLARLKPPPGVEPRAAVAVHTGLVVVGDPDSPVPLSGGTLHVAIELQSRADAGSVVVTEATRTVIAGHYDCLPAGLLESAQGTVSVDYFLLQAPREGPAAAAAHASTPMVGRESERAQLEALWEPVPNGQGAAVLVSGDAGIGKSRLIHAFREAVTAVSAGASEPRWLELRCQPHQENAPLFCVLAGLRELLAQSGSGWFLPARGATPLHPPGPDDYERLAALVGDVLGAEDQPRRVALLGHALGLAPRGRALGQASPTRRRRETLGLLVRLFVELAERRPLVLVIEDLQWIDPSTLELVGMLLRQGKRCPLFLVMSARPDSTPRWPSRARVTHLQLGPLADVHVRALITGARGRSPAVSDDEVARILRRAEGSPLHAIALAAAARRDPEANVPPTLHAALLAGLDELTDAREVVRHGALIGNSFHYGLLEASSSLVPGDLIGRLDRLVDAGVLERRGAHPRARYIFPLEPLREAICRAMRLGDRQTLHSAIADALPSDAPARRRARHLTEAGRIPEAIAAWQRAGEEALAGWALHEAIADLRLGLALVEGLPDGPERVERELGLRSLLLIPLPHTRGCAATDAEAERAHDLCRRAPASSRLFASHWRVWDHHHFRADHRRAESLADGLLALGAATAETAILLGGHLALGATRFHRGDLHAAREHFDVALALYDGDLQPTIPTLLPQDPAVFALAHLAWVHWHLGNPEQAHRHAGEALGHSERLEQPHSRCLAEHFVSVLHCLSGDADRARAHANRTLALADDQEAPRWAALAQIDLGWANLIDGRATQASESLSEGLDALTLMGGRLGLTCWRSAQATAALSLGRTEEAQQLLDDAMDMVEESDERAWEALLHRLRAEIAEAR